MASRFFALPKQPPNRAPIWDLLEAAADEADPDRQANEIDDVLNRYRS